MGRGEEQSVRTSRRFENRTPEGEHLASVFALLFMVAFADDCWPAGQSYLWTARIEIMMNQEEDGEGQGHGRERRRRYLPCQSTCPPTLYFVLKKEA